MFKEKGVLRVGKVTHHKKGDKEPPVAYTIMDTVVSEHKKSFFCYLALFIFNCEHSFHISVNYVLSFSRNTPLRLSSLKMINGCHSMLMMCSWNLYALIHLSEWDYAKKVPLIILGCCLNDVHFFGN